MASPCTTRCAGLRATVAAAPRVLRRPAARPSLRVEASSGEATSNAVSWATATVIENTSVSANDATRQVRLSVEDRTATLEGRDFGLKRSGARWVDAYTLPGQYVGVTLDASAGDGAPADCLLAIASTPYESRADSANLDATLIDVLVDKTVDGAKLAELEPGAQVQVSEPRGQGFSSVLGLSTLSSCLDTSEKVVMIAMDSSGIAAMHAVVEWAPVQAHAAATGASLFYVAQDRFAASYLKDWDEWRTAGVNVVPIYQCDNEDEDGLEPNDHLIRRLAAELFSQKPVFGSDPSRCCVLMAGMPPKVTAALSRQLQEMGVPGERLLFAQPPRA